MNATALLTEARAAFASGHFEHALTLAQALIAYHPANTAALSIVANAAMQLQRLGEANAALGALLSYHPKDAAIARSRSRVLNRLGHQCAENQDIPSAVAHWQEALQLWPENAEAVFNLVTHQATTLHDDAAVELLLPSFERAPEDLGLRLLLTQIERDRGRHDRAAELLRPLASQTLERHDTRSLALTLGAADLVERSLPIALPLVEQVNSLQIAFATLSTLQNAPASEVLHTRAVLCHRIGASAPSLRIAIAKHLSLPSVHRDRESILVARSRFSSGLSQLAEEFTQARLSRCEPLLAQLNWSNFLLAYQCEDDLDLQSRYGNWLHRAARTLRPDLADRTDRRKPGAPRIGLFSGHWNDTTAGSYFASWIEALDVAEFDTRIYALGPRFDSYTDVLEKRSRCFVRLEGDIDRAAELIRDADLDLLIYPELGMDTRLMPIAALPLARQQWVGWGHPVTSGLPSIDAFLSCAEMEPPDAAAHYRERLLLLPDLGTRYRMPTAPRQLSRQALGLPMGKLVVIPQSLFKIHPDNDAVIEELLTRMPEARVLLFVGSSRLDVHILGRRLHLRLGDRLFRQLHFHPMVSRGRFLEILACADLMLDTLHWSGGNTSLDALRAGLPIATSRSHFMRGRQSAAMLEALGLQGGIAADVSALPALAISLLRHNELKPSAEALATYMLSERPTIALNGLAHRAIESVM